MTSNKKLKVLVIVGPTASGKSSLAVELAKKIKGEIISADSRQVYRGMNIGTGKVTKKEMAGIPHYLLDVANPKTQFSAAKYQKLAEASLQKIVKRGKVPIIVGGTGFYIDALLNPGLVPTVPPNKVLRLKLQKNTAGELADKLKKLDLATWKRIDRKNPRRLVRAIEIALALGKVPPSSQESRPDWEVLIMGINPEPDILKAKIWKRLLARLKLGMITEVKKLKRNGLSWQRLEDFGLEYRRIAEHLLGKTSRAEMLERLNTDIWRYAKRQKTWFGRNKKIRWVKSKAEALKLAQKFLS